MAKPPSNEKWESILEDCLSEHSFSTFRLTITPNTKVTKCSGLIFKVLVEGRRERDFKIDFLTMKCLESQEEDLRSLFKTESIVYNEVISNYDELQLDVPRASQLNFPFCYKSSDEFVIMEDLTMKNYVVETEELNFDQTTFALSYLGKFHALSFGLRQRKKDEYERLAEALNKDYFSYKKIDSEAIESAIKLAEDSLDDLELGKKLRSVCDSQDWKKINKNYTAICHGDYTSENLFFAYDEELEPMYLKMIDYQLTNISSPVTDFLTLLLSSASPEVISQFETVSNMYYTSMQLFVKKFECLIKDCYPENVFQEDLKNHLGRSLVRMLIDAKNKRDYTVDSNKWYINRINGVVKVLSDIKLI